MVWLGNRSYSLGLACGKMLAFTPLVSYHLTISVKRRLNNQLAKGHLLMKKLQKQQSGFTIIEVLIVLAIAGLIMLIVFLAVPALQRNSRNTQRRNDVSTYLGAVNEWSNNNQGRIPTANTDLTTANTGVNALAKLGVYTAPTTATNGATAQTAITAVDTMRYVYGATCGTGGATTPGSGRAYAIQFAVEGSGSSSISQCQDS